MLAIYHDLAIESRRALLQELLHGPRTVTQLVEATGFKQPNVSNHLAKMRESGSVRVRREGRQMFYRLGAPEVADAVQNAVNARDDQSTELNLPELAERYTHFAVMGDEARCTDIVDFALRTHQPQLEVYESLITRAMRLVGRMYEQRTIDEAQEHMASEITERLMARISSAFSPARPNGFTAVLGCAANNWHVIGLRMLADLLRAQGWRVVYLGANVPTESFVRSVERHAADVVLVSSSAESIAEARGLVQALRSASPKTLIALGGSGVNAVPERFDDLPLNFRGVGLRDTLDYVDSVRAQRAELA